MVQEDGLPQKMDDLIKREGTYDLNLERLENAREAVVRMEMLAVVVEYSRVRSGVEMVLCWKVKELGISGVETMTLWTENRKFGSKGIFKSISEDKFPSSCSVNEL